MNDNTEKYPPNIQKLFQPKPPFPYISPIDYPPEKRSTKPISPLSSIKNEIDKYLTSELPERESKAQAVPKKISKIVKHKQKQHEANLKRLAKEKDHERQLEEWNNPTLFAKQEREFMKDPFRTVFIARLDYNLTELDISRAFARYGMIESIRIIRDKQGKSRGYGFVVYERNTDAMNCVNDLSRTGLKLGNRPILVDIERSRVLKNWRPRRLGGGEGGRGYVKEGKVQSVAASARRIVIANNPSFNTAPPQHDQQQFQYHHHQQQQQQHQPQFQTQYNTYTDSYSPQLSQRYSSGSRTASDVRAPATSIKDKYAKYSSIGTNPATEKTYSYKPASDDRSIRNIRRRD
ncbi:U1 small nuclear ribonucleoprotein 70kDa [Candida albicans P57072]|nr:U1 small nuclear ribonucleoprotein 70kDa [Candida albicans P57072]KHC39608.1 U1 small nuclear ribonucleoprotein 70kDa [Candida albicans P76067]